jgi:hypothetical protein
VEEEIENSKDSLQLRARIQSADIAVLELEVMAHKPCFGVCCQVPAIKILQRRVRRPYE